MNSSGTVAPSWGQRILGLEGLRAVAATAVLVYHVGHVYTPKVEVEYGELFRLLDQGLTLFFVLSGFLLFWPFASRLIEGREHPSIRSYAFNRALRIWPAYLVILAIAAFVLRVALRPDGTLGTLSWRGFLLNATLLQNYSIEWQRSGLEVAWTLTVELTFYALLPIMVVAVEKLFPRLRRAYAAFLPVAFMLLLGGVGRAVVIILNRRVFLDASEWGKTGFSLTARSLFAQADMFGVGMAAALVFIAFRKGVFSPRQAPLVRGGLVVGGILAIVFFQYGVQADFLTIASAVGFGCILLLVVLPGADGGHSLWARVLDWRPIRWVGVVSFSLYLWHLVLIRFFIQHGITFGGGRLGFFVSTVVVLALALALSAATYYGVEKQALRLKRRNRPLPADVPALAGRRESWRPTAAAAAAPAAARSDGASSRD
ncbi:acyltransferase family protein [Frondihabitans australicus]|uniref:Peptidoglycan/LPS O-acetylase OafA/YrhL n=1 Tax=Frondihabitans australicus TaxID=386892 RepID=A0A495IHJ0_9MICO|nr:acyltransferase [Frondihabitans australicus]RKR74625.1 peptidoglycan/LPS O-acetylase OafA/YrhL [Frondihabitans australicus]